MKATWLFHARSDAGATQAELADALSLATKKLWHTETIRNIEKLLVGIDEETETTIQSALADIKRQKIAPKREEVTAA